MAESGLHTIVIGQPMLPVVLLVLLGITALAGCSTSESAPELSPITSALNFRASSDMSTTSTSVAVADVTGSAPWRSAEAPNEATVDECPQDVMLFGPSASNFALTYPSIAYVTLGELHRSGLVFEGFDVSESSESQVLTPLIAAVLTRCAADVRLLLELGADPSQAAVVSGRTPGEAALEVDRVDILVELLEGGVDVMSTGTEDAPLVHLAISHSAGRALAELLERRADPTVRHFGRTPIEWAAYNGWLEGVQTLAPYSADLLGYALYSAIEERQQEVVAFLLKSGVPLESPPPDYMIWSGITDVSEAAELIADQAIIDLIVG